ncbi:MAG: M20/M25/M40 family metallo-hydrolase [Clostridia bacterium]|nr:M20/M25/M40 family metallo-hydrolase [Clostridia bacterium]
MDYTLPTPVLRYLEEQEEATLELIESLCRIPAPSGQEATRAAFCKEWLTAKGAKGVYVDDALNTLYPVNCDGRDDIILFLAHTDTVFPDTEPMPVHRDGDYLYSPGVGDDTTCLAQLLTVAGYVAQANLTPDCGILFAANAGEEGLGNLKGIRQIMKDYAGRIREVYSFDWQYTAFVNKCVGSHRYEITFATEGGHSFGAFGNRNAIRAAADLVCDLYSCLVPMYGNSRTTYNVGTIEGGTSVNTIAQNAKLLYEYRSDNAKCLEEMRRFFESKIAAARKKNTAEITVTPVGERPCGGGVDAAHLARMSETVARVSQKYSGLPCVAQSGSTDCNIPMSLGVPAVCVGTYLGSGQHTREERVLLSSIPVGLKIVAELILSHFA